MKVLFEDGLLNIAEKEGNIHTLHYCTDIDGFLEVTLLWTHLIHQICAEHNNHVWATLHIIEITRLFTATWPSPFKRHCKEIDLA